jgi:8-amino-7-oxononanoate synthase
MLDFTSALYLGFTHASASLAPWRALTLGRPAALEEPPGALHLAGDLAQLMGCKAGLLFPSTLHLFRDLFTTLADKGSVILVDAAAYAIARWGMEFARLQGVSVESYPHHDATALERRVRRATRAGLRPIVVTDGVCPSCGRAAPLPALARIAGDAGGRLVIDDTQALGVLGDRPTPKTPLGCGGGGSLLWYGLSAPHVLTGASLAKGFGVPIAVLGGAEKLIEQIERQGETRIHCSPPSAASIAAGLHAAIVNRSQGDGLRARLLRRIEQLRDGLRRAGLGLLSVLPLPMQSIELPSLRAGRVALAILERLGIRTLLTRSCRAGAPTLTALVTARHAAADIDRLVAGLVAAVRATSNGSRLGLEVS